MNWTQKERLIYQHFSKITPEDDAVFAPFHQNNLFGDTTFSLLYAWESEFQYAYRQWDEVLVVLEHGVKGRLSCIVLWKDAARFTPVAADLYRMFRQAELPLYFKYVREEDLPLYLQAAAKIGESAEVAGIWDDSDYIYRTEDFLSLTGKQNKRKRGDLNNVVRHYPDLRVEFHGRAGRDLRRECLDIFGSWCTGRSCGRCVYGCELNAFRRFLEIFDQGRHRLAVSYADGQALSFAACERINPEMDCYHFQKNVRPIRGLTYWLNREMALECPKATYINLAEDMGLPGLRQEKMGLHPFKREAKYTVCIK